MQTDNVQSLTFSSCQTESLKSTFRHVNWVNQKKEENYSLMPVSHPPPPLSPPLPLSPPPRHSLTRAFLRKNINKHINRKQTKENVFADLVTQGIKPEQSAIFNATLLFSYQGDLGKNTGEFRGGRGSVTHYHIHTHTGEERNIPAVDH